MKRVIVLIVMTLVAIPVCAQLGPGVVEASISASLQSVSKGGGSSSTNILISPRVGFFLHDGLEIEPELVFFVPDESDVPYMVNGNVAYNFLSSSKAYPFLLVGYGIANTVPFFGIPFSRYDFTVGVLNIGGGMKALLSERVAIRVEYRFQKFSGEGPQQGYYPYVYTSKADYQLHTFQFGFSVLL